MAGASIHAASAAPVGRDAAACKSGQPAVQVHVVGFKEPGGTVKINLYDSSGYLQKGGRIRKVTVAVSSARPLDVCIAVPGPGRYAVAVHHDVNANGERDLNDGGGYSRNPRLSLTNLKPAFGKTVITVGSAPKLGPVQLQYRKGLSVGPVA